MVAAANPLAAEAGMAMLRQGGSAVAAAIATALVLGLVEPPSSGLGGGAFLLHYAGAPRGVAAYDARATAPPSAHEPLFPKPDGTPLTFWAALSGRPAAPP